MVLRKWRRISFGGADEMVVADDLHQRKAAMESRADAFVVLPGGFGTLDEATDVVAQRLIGAHDKPVVFVNTDGCYDPLLHVFEHMIAKGFAKPKHRRGYEFVDGADAALRCLEAHWAEDGSPKA